MIPQFVCCFCKEIFKGYGNNPYPANKRNGAKCCDKCNSRIVIPARFEVLKGGNNGN